MSCLAERTTTKIRPGIPCPKTSTGNDKRALDFPFGLTYRPGSSLHGEVAEAVSAAERKMPE
jgi:hypothetical protein